MENLYLEYGTMVVTGVLALLGVLWSKVIWERIKDMKGSRIILRTWLELKSALLSVHQTYVKALREANQDGKLTEAEKKMAMERALKEAKSNIGTKGLKRLARILGLSSVESWLSTQAEGLLAEMKSSGELPSSKDFVTPATDAPPKQ